MSPSPTVSISLDPSSPALDGPGRWALDRLRATARARGLRLADAGTGAGDHLLVAAPGGALAAEVLAAAGAPGRPEAESFALARRSLAGVDTLVVAGADTRGLVHALLELADVLRCSDRPATALATVRTRYEHPHVPVRSLSRMFACHDTDLAWFHDRAFWDEYLTELATHRFNRFSLGFGLAYDYLIDRRVTDNYFCFLYPFVLAVPGYDVTVAGLTAEERQRNLESLQHIAAATAQRGLDFSLGLWNHAYRLDPVTPSERWLVSGLDASDHAAYCRDALELLLRACPEISGLTFRVHFEGGVPEPTHEFWRTVTGALAAVDRPVRLDAHAKGVDDRLLDALAAPGAPVTLSTKYWAEHMGLPYHQASIRHRERGRREPSPDERDPDEPEEDSPEAGRGLGGAATTRRRSFTRYGYADHARDDVPYRLLHRIWPGTQRVLLSGDPVMAAGIGRQAGFAGSEGVEWFEPLTFLGRKDSAAHPPAHEAPRTDRDLYRDPALSLPGVTSWRKYAYTLRLWGRLSYDPDADPEGWRRHLRHTAGSAAADAEAALAAASRILPLVLTTHAPSVAGNLYWPEMCTPIPLVALDPPAENPGAEFGWHADARFDMTAPYTFGSTSTLDPELFATVDEYVDSLLDPQPSAKYSPLEVADWLQQLAGTALDHLGAIRGRTDPGADVSADLRRLVVDVDVQAHLGLFFAGKLRAGVAWRWHERTADPASLDAALQAYRSARAAWQRAADVADVYRPDLPFGRMPYQRGHWADRLPAIDDDLATLAGHAAAGRCQAHADRPAGPLPRAPRIAVQVEHVPPAALVRGRPLTLALTVRGGHDLEVRVHHRPVDQSAAWQVVRAVASGDRFAVDLPAAATVGDHSLQYFVDVRSPAGTALYPGLDPVHLSNQPYLVVHADPGVTWGRAAPGGDR